MSAFCSMFSQLLKLFPRWQIELFFKALKQNLKIKTFVGTSANALKVQVWTALIAILLLKYLQLQIGRASCRERVCQYV